MRAPTAAALAVLVAVPAAAYDHIEFLEPVPVPGAARGEALAASGDRFYLADPKRGVLLILDRTGKEIRSVGGLADPAGLAVGPEGHVYVAEAGASRVRVFDAEGEPLRSFGRKGSGAGELSKPRGLAVGADGRVYVADTGNDRVQVFTAEGIFLFPLGGKGKEPGLFRGPAGVAVTPSDEVYVLDAGNDRVQKFGADARFAKELPLHGEDFAVDGYGLLYMLDRGKGKVTEVSPDGLVLGRFGTPGSGLGQFRKAAGVAAAPDGTILVGDAGNKRIQGVRLTSKLRSRRLPHNLATKLVITGPERSFPLAASAIAPLGPDLFAFLPAEKAFVRLGPDGAEKARFAAEGPSAPGEIAGLAASPERGLYAADARKDRLQRYSLDGKHAADFGGTEGLFASKGKEGRVRAPRGMATDDKGTVYVADAGNGRVQAYNHQGAFLFSFGPTVGPHALKEPADVAWDPEGFLYVLDRKLKLVLKCVPSGGFQKAWGGEGEGVENLDDPAALAYDGRRYLYVLDRGRSRVAVFDREGRWVTNFFGPGADLRSLSAPADLAVQDGQLVISDPGRGRISAFALHPQVAPPSAVSTRTVEGRVFLSWEPREDPWVRGYRVLRSSGPWGPFAPVGESRGGEFADEDVEPFREYHYQVASIAETGDVGPPSYPAAVFVPGAVNRPPVEIAALSVGDIFSANYKWYLKNPVGRLTLVNNVNEPFQNVKVSFKLKDFMDYPTETVLPRLEGRASVEVPLSATLNNRILEVSEDTPIQAEASVTYFQDGRKQELSLAQPLKVYSRNAIVWRDPRRIANYVTPNDPPVLDLSKGTERLAGDVPGAEHLNEGLKTAARLWEMLGALGFQFAPSPNNPFERVSQDPAFPVDYTQFPRDTIRRVSGECDDLATLLASMLESVGVRAALLDYPGHLAVMFDTGSSDPLQVGLPPEKMIEHQGTWWVPIEATMVGSPFEEAADRAASDYRRMAAEGKAKIIDLREAWTVYEPATLPPYVSEFQFGLEKTAVPRRFARFAEAYLERRFRYLAGHWEGLLREEGENALALVQLGLVHAQHSRLEEARRLFERALAQAPGDAAALNNLGNLDYLAGRHQEALERYARAAESDPQDAGIRMNLSRTAAALSDRAAAEEHARKAVELDGELKEEADRLLKR